MSQDDLKKNPKHRNWLIDEHVFKKKSLLIICLICLITLGFHLAIVYSLSLLKTSKPLASAAKKTKQNYELLYYEPHPMCFVEVNTELAPQSPPENTINFAAQSQRAAQENPGLPSLQEIPTLQGDDEVFSKITQGSLISQEDLTEMLDPFESAFPAGTEDFVEPEKLVQNGVKLVERPKPKLRPKLNRTPMGLLKKNDEAVSKYGITAINARFTQFGEYIQKMHEAIGSQFHLLFANYNFTAVDFGSCVSIFYSLDEMGNVTSIGIKFSTASNLAVILCKDAILSQAPFGPWTDDMKAILSKEEKFHCNFLFD